MTDKQEQALVVLTEAASRPKRVVKSYLNKRAFSLDDIKAWLSDPENQRTLVRYGIPIAGGSVLGSLLHRRNPLLGMLGGGLLGAGGGWLADQAYKNNWGGLKDWWDNTKKPTKGTKTEAPNEVLPNAYNSADADKYPGYGPAEKGLKETPGAEAVINSVARQPQRPMKSKAQAPYNTGVGQGGGDVPFGVEAGTGMPENLKAKKSSPRDTTQLTENLKRLRRQQQDVMDLLNSQRGNGVFSSPVLSRLFGVEAMHDYDTLMPRFNALRGEERMLRNTLNNRLNGPRVR